MLQNRCLSTFGDYQVSDVYSLAGRNRRASFCPFIRSSVHTFVRPSIRQHLTWVSCERNRCLSTFEDYQVSDVYSLAGRNRRASFCPFIRSSLHTFIRPSIRQHLTWVSCERNSSYSFAPIVLKLCMCFLHCMRICMWIGHNCWISFCHFFDIVNLVIFHPDYIDRGYLL